MLRAAHATAQRRALLRDAAKQFPGNSLLRYERTLDGTKDEGLWMHLGADADRVLNLASTYLRLGMSDDAIALLRRRYPAVPPEQREPGEPSPQDDPRAGYLLAYAVQNSRKGDAAPLWKAASEMRVRFVFPNRAEMLPVLKMAIEKNARDATAHFLLGSLLFSRGIVKPALAEWQQARERNPKLPGLHYSLARALSKPLPPVEISQSEAPCQQVVIENPKDVNEHLVPIRHTALEKELTVGSGIRCVSGAQFGDAVASSVSLSAASEPAKVAAPEMKLVRPAPEPCGS